MIGRLPIMLRSQLCHLYGKSEQEMIAMKECPLDPGGYFIIDGGEKALMMQEQAVSNRIMIEQCPKKLIQAVVTSNTSENKSRLVVCYSGKVKSKDRLYVKHSGFTVPIPLIIMIKAMGADGITFQDSQISQMVGCGSDGTVDPESCSKSQKKSSEA